MKIDEDPTPEEWTKIRDFLVNLGIPVHNYAGFGYLVDARDFKNLVINEESCDELIAKLKNRAFW